MPRGEGAAIALVVICLLELSEALVFHYEASAENSGPVKEMSLEQIGNWTPDKNWSPYEWILNREGNHRAFFHMHIPKNAGISFLRDVLEVVPPGAGLFSAEHCFDQLKANKGFIRARGDSVITLLRKPRDHVYSQYLECADDAWGIQVVPQDKKPLLANFSMWLRHFNAGGMIADDLGCYHPLNLQTRAFLCENRMHHLLRKPTGSDVKRAVARLRSTFFVGLSEYYQESMCLLHEKVWQKLPAWCNCEDPKRWGLFHPAHESHGTRKHTVSEVNEQDLRLVDELTKDDQQLYRAAKRRFVREIADMERRHGLRVMC